MFLSIGEKRKSANNANRGSHAVSGYSINTRYFSGNKPMSVSSYFEIFAIRSHSFYRKKISDCRNVPR